MVAADCSAEPKRFLPSLYRKRLLVYTVGTSRPDSSVSSSILTHSALCHLQAFALTVLLPGSFPPHISHLANSYSLSDPSYSFVSSKKLSECCNRDGVPLSPFSRPPNVHILTSLCTHSDSMVSPYHHFWALITSLPLTPTGFSLRTPAW